MKTSKALLNDLVKQVADLTGMTNYREDAVTKNQPYYLILMDGWKNVYSLCLKDVKNGSIDSAFPHISGYYKASEMQAMLRGLIAGLNFKRLTDEL